MATTPRPTQVRRVLITARFVFAVIIGIFWDIVTGLILFFHDYSFFETVVISLLVMLLCGIATLLVESDPWSPTEDSDNADLMGQGRSQLKVLFYWLAFVMAVVKLVKTLIVTVLG